MDQQTYAGTKGSVSSTLTDSTFERAEARLKEEKIKATAAGSYLGRGFVFNMQKLDWANRVPQSRQLVVVFAALILIVPQMPGLKAH